VASLLPAISMGLKRSTDTPDGLGNLFALMARQPDLYAAYNDPRIAFSPEARDAGNAVLSTMFGSPDASRAIAGQAQQLSGISSTILKKLLPVIVGLIISGLMRSGSGRAAPQAPQPAPQSAPEQGGGLIDILRQIFQQGQAEATNQPDSGSSPWGIPPIGDILGTDRGGTASPQKAPQMPMPTPADQPVPQPTDAGGGNIPGGDLLPSILRELEKAIREGRLKPIVVGPIEIGIPGQAGPVGSDQTQAPGGDILGQILREVLKGGQAQLPRQGVGAAVFGDRLEPGRGVGQAQIDSFQEVLDQFLGAQRR
jgi:hypothetical protein